MSYLRAHFPQFERVAGVRLHALTMGHALMLARLGCPLLPGGEARLPAPGDVAVLLWVCSRPWRTAVRRASSLPARWWRAYVAGRVLASHVATVDAVRKWLKKQCAGPELAAGTRGGTLRSPTLAALKVAAMCDLGLTEAEIMDRPLGLTIWEVLVAAERRGDVELKPTPDAFQFLLTAAKAMEAPHGQ